MKYKIDIERWQEALKRNFLIIELYQFNQQNNLNCMITPVDGPLKKGDVLSLLVTKKCQSCYYGEISHEYCPNCKAPFPPSCSIHLPCTNCDGGSNLIKAVEITIKELTGYLEMGLAMGYQLITFDPPKE